MKGRGACHQRTFRVGRRQALLRGLFNSWRTDSVIAGQSCPAMLPPVGNRPFFLQIANVQSPTVCDQGRLRKADRMDKGQTDWTSLPGL